jgi:hypothetical protein
MNKSRLLQELFVIIFITLFSSATFAAERYVINTKDDNFFENFVSDTSLLLTPDLRKIISANFDTVVNNSKFQPQPNSSWLPKPNPRIKLNTIYNRISSDNIKENFAYLVNPIVEIACSSPSQNDPMGDKSSKCIKQMLKYPVIQTIEINYVYDSNKTFEQIVSSLSGLNDINRYQQMVISMADIMNKSFEKIGQKTVSLNAFVTKYPLALQTSSLGGSKVTSSSLRGGGSCQKPTHSNSSSISAAKQYRTDMMSYQHCLDLELARAGGTPTRNNSAASGVGSYPQQKDPGPCMGDCGSEMGICQSQCMGNGSCIARCAESHGRCVARCN